MTKLLSANFSRLMRDKIFWISGAAMFILSAVMIIRNGMSVSVSDMDPINTVKTLNACYFNILPAISFFYAVFISLFIGTEYSDGTIRNKIVIGHSRVNIYFSNYITCLAGTLVILIAMLLGCAIGFHFFGSWQGGIKDFLIKILLCIFITAVYTAIITLVSMLTTNKTIALVLTLVVCILFVFCGSSIYEMLLQPEFTRDFLAYNADGSIQFGPEKPNPAYLGGTKRQICAWLLQFLPSCQSILITNEEVTNPLLNMIYSVLFAAAIHICGVLAFRKKNLK